jgi:LysR family hydrogen peroxide-inducible transcriptional activator
MLPRINYSLTQLEYVLAVYKHGHFAKAAEASQITQPTLSMQIQKLENDLGIVIFDRSKKPILLTDAGKKFVEQAKAILFEAKKLTELVEGNQTDLQQGHLNLGVIPTIAPYLLPRLLPILEKFHPKVELRILELQTHRIVEALNNDDIDIGLLATPLKIPQIHEYPLFYEPFSVLCRKGHDLAKSKKAKYSMLKYEDLWLLEEGHCLRNQMLDVCSLKKDKLQRRKYEFESGSLETLKNLVNSYGGYTLLPTLASESIGSNSVLIPFERPIPAREVGLVYRREYYKKELIEIIGEAILKSIPEDLGKIRQKDLDVLPIENR